jgi:hypothetical protein
MTDKASIMRAEYAKAAPALTAMPAPKIKNQLRLSWMFSIGVFVREVSNG